MPRAADVARGLGCLVLLLVQWACASDEPVVYKDYVGADAKVHVVFEPPAQGKVTFGEVPFPDVLYTSEGGAVPLWEPKWSDSADEELSASIRSHLDAVDGFGVFGPIYFPVSGDISLDSLPESSAASEKDDASVFVIDTDTNSPRSYQRVPVVVEYDSKHQRIVVRPAEGTSFRAGRSYAAVATRRLLDADGEPVGPSAAFAQVRDAERAPEGRNLERAHRSYQPLFGALADQGVDRDSIVGMASFRVQNVAAEMSEARARLVAAVMPPELSVEVSGTALDEVLGTPDTPDLGLSAEGGVEHSHLAAMIHGSVMIPQLLARKPFDHGYFSRNEDDALEIKRVESVPFTLFMPTMVDPQLELPLVVYVHGMSGDRSDALGIADRFAEKRIAVVALDGPFNGQRAPGRDRFNRFTGEEQADGFGDGPATWIADSDETGPLAPFHPLYFRDALRQAALDVLVFLAAAREHSLESLTPQPFDLDHVALVGVGTGGTIALMVAALDKGVQTVVPANTGGGIVVNWAESPAHEDLFASIRDRLGVDAGEVESQAVLDAPELALYQLLLDRADPVAWAAEFEDSAVRILQLAAGKDESVSMPSANRLASALSLLSLPAEEIFVSAGVQERPQARFPDGTHGLLLGARDELRYESPFERPFNPLDEPLGVDVPYAAAADLAVEYIFWQVCVAADGATASCQQGR